MLRAVETRFGPLSTYIFPSAYDQTKLGLGPAMIQLNGAGENDKWAGPCPVTVARPVEWGSAVPGFMPWAMRWSNTIDWIFLADNATVAVTRRIRMMTYNRATGVYTDIGFITLTYPTATNHTVRGFRMTYDKYTTGSAAVSGTAVTGTSTAWSASRLAVGSRIGFGSIDPAQIQTWYEISAIGSDTGITLTGSGGTIADGPYVIEDLRAITENTNATTTNGGLYVTKGLRPEIFILGGTTIPAATTIDKIRAVYWLADAATVTNTIALGLDVESKIDWTTQYAYAPDTTTTVTLFKYNLRASLSDLASGKSVLAFVLKSAASAAVTGAPTQIQNFTIATAGHGTGNGVKCGYFTTASRVYRTKGLDSITSLDATWLSAGDYMTEIPPGGVATFGATGALANIQYVSEIDRFVILSTGATAFRHYITQYRQDGTQWDRNMLADLKQINQSTMDGGAGIIPSLLTLQPTVFVIGGIAYFITHGTTGATNMMYSIPLAADWEFASNTSNRLVTPAISSPNCVKYTRLYVSEVGQIGGSSPRWLGYTPESFRAYYRTAGISDNSGTWNLLGDYGDLSGVDGAASIQFMFEFRTISLSGLGARILAIAVLYQDDSTDSHYEASVAKSVIADRQFAWRQKTDWGGNIPAMRIRLWNAATGVSLIDDNTTDHAYGTFEYSSNGTDWYSWSASQQGVGYYIRYTATSLPDGVKVRALLTQV